MRIQSEAREVRTIDGDEAIVEFVGEQGVGHLPEEEFE
jgi:hypothetical protein